MKCDYAVRNYEVPIRIDRRPEKHPGKIHNQLESTISGLKQQGFDLMLLANNHMLDYGKEGLESTINEIKK